MKAGLKGTNSASALDWSRWGEKLAEPMYGAVGVISYGGGKGHVGFVVSINSDKSINMLGGNQSDSVKVSTYKRSQFVAFVWPKGVEKSNKLSKLSTKGSNSSYESTR